MNVRTREEQIDSEFLVDGERFIFAEDLTKEKFKSHIDETERRGYGQCQQEMVNLVSWQHMETAPKDGTVVEIFQGNRNCWTGNGIALARFWTAEQLAELDGPGCYTEDYEGGWYLASSASRDGAEDEVTPWFWRPLYTPSEEMQKAWCKERGYEWKPYTPES